MNEGQDSAKQPVLTTSLFLIDFLCYMEVGPYFKEFLANPLFGRFERALLNPNWEVKPNHKDTGKGVFQITNGFAVDHFSSDRLKADTNTFSDVVLPLYPKLANIPVYQISIILNYISKRLEKDSFLNNIDLLKINLRDINLLDVLSNHKLAGDLIEFYSHYHHPSKPPKSKSIKRIVKYVRDLDTGLFFEKAVYV